MLIIPAIDIRDGRCVRLVQGDFDRQTVYGDDPLTMAKQWQAQGARLLHVVDLDGTKDGKAVNRPIIEQIIRELGMPVEVAGGIRTVEAAKTWLSAGAARIVVGTMAFEDRSALKQLLAIDPTRVVVSLETKNGRLVTRGWQKEEDGDLVSVAQELELLGVQRFLYTDADKDGMLAGPNYDLVQALVRAVRVPIIASGGVNNAASVTKLRALGAETAIVGKALYEGKVTLKELQDVS